MSEMKYLDDPFVAIGGYEFTPDEKDDLFDWFDTEKPSVDELSAREYALYCHWKGRMI